MEVLIDNSGYGLSNLGDVAMLQCAVERLRSLWPEATLRVLTHEPQRLQAFCPEATPLSARGREQLFDPGKLFPRVQSVFPSLEDVARRRTPRFAVTATRSMHRLRRRDHTAMDELVAVLDRADLVVASGGGYVTDPFARHAIPLLNLLEIAARRGTATAMLGQGLGPLTDRRLARSATGALRRVDVIHLREERAARPLLRRLGVDPARIATTGDDAVEVAYTARPPDLGDAIGVNLRKTPYAGVDEDEVSELGGALVDVIGQGTALLPLPISLSTDTPVVQRLLQVVGGEDAMPSVDTPADVVHQIGRCRLVITGSYHAGVFALAQGIPIIGLTKSAYYDQKLAGLADQFGVGCHLVDMRMPDWSARLRSLVGVALAEADVTREELLAAAARQVDAGRAAYARIPSLIGTG